MKIVVIGGTGRVGSKLVNLLADQGHEALAAAPDTGVDTITGAGLADALEGAAVVVDVSNSPSFEDDAVMHFFETSTSNLLAAEHAAGVRHHVALSVVGTQGLRDAGYFRAKIVQERLIADSGIPYSIVHATQFFEFLPSVADSATDGDVVRVPPVLFQPMASDDVAAAVARAVLGPPVNGIVEVGGPEQFRFDELIQRWLAAHDDPRHVVSDVHARYFGAELHERSLVPADDAPRGTIRLADWLAQTVPSA